jgi:antitoxin FitA
MEQPLEQTVIRRLKPGTLSAYRTVAKTKGRSLEAELRDLIERNAPKVRLTPEERRALSDRLVAGQKMGTDSTILVREAREARDTQMDRINAGG